MHSRPPASAYAAAVGMTVAFGLSFVATKYALRGFEPLLLALLRFALAGGVLWVVWRLRRGPARVSRGELGRLAVLGFVSLTVYFSFANAGIAALVLLGGGGAGGGSLTGNLLVLAASLSAGVYSILARRLLVSRPALFVTTFQNLFGALFMLPLALAEAALVGVRHPTPRATGGLLFLTVVCSITAYLLLNYAFRFIPASKVAVFINLTPIVAVASAYVLLGERFTPGQAIAAAVVVAGVWVTNSGGGAARSPSAG